MPLKDILVYIDSPDDADSGTAAAIVLAYTHSAHLTGLYLLQSKFSDAHYKKPSPQRPQPSRRQETERAGTAGRAFKAAADVAGVSADWIIASSDFSSPASLAKTCNSYARLADLTVFARPAEVAPERHRDRVLQSFILGSGRPVLVLPGSGSSRFTGRRVIVAWDCSKEAARAVNDALPLLGKAETVEVVTVGLATGENIPGAALCKHLGRHGIAATAHKIQALESNVGEALIATVESSDSDLIVLGAYGRSRSGELLLADVTGSLLDNAKTALLMSH